MITLSQGVVFFHIHAISFLFALTHCLKIHFSCRFVNWGNTIGSQRHQSITICTTVCSCFPPPQPLDLHTTKLKWSSEQPPLKSKCIIALFWNSLYWLNHRRCHDLLLESCYRAEVVHPKNNIKQKHPHKTYKFTIFSICCLAKWQTDDFSCHSAAAQWLVLILWQVT